MITATLTTYRAKMANDYFWADYHVNAVSEKEARKKLRALAEDGELADAAEEEYEMAVKDDRYDPNRRDYTYRISDIEAADGYDPRAEDAPHHIDSGGNG